MAVTTTYTCDICGAKKTFDGPLMTSEFGGWRWFHGLYICSRHTIESAVIVDGVERKRRVVTKRPY